MIHPGAIFRRSNATTSPAMQSWGSMLAMVLAFGGFWPADAWSADHWVGPKGRDANGQGSRTSPWATLQYAADRVRPGDTVHVLEGDYTGFDLRRGGNQQALVGFKAEGKRVRIVRRNQKTPDGINVEQAGYVVIDGFSIYDMPRAGVRAANSPHVTIRGIRTDRNGMWGIFTAFCDDVTIEGNHTSNSQKEHGIYVSNSGDRPIVRANTTWGNWHCGIHMNGDLSQGGDGIISHAVVESNVIFENGKGGGSGINCDGVQNSKFQNNLIYNNHASGISLYGGDSADGSKRNSVINNTIVQASDGRWALNITDKSAGNLIANNILFHKGSRGSITVSADSLPGLRSDHNILVDRLSSDDGNRLINLKDWQSTTKLDRHSRIATLQDVFANPGANDYHLRPGSPALGAADPTLAPTYDITASARPIGAAADIGAFEADEHTAKR
jgi:parallel beta-helix repeat protein